MKKVLIVFAAIVLGLAVVVKVNAETKIIRTPNLINRAENKATRSATYQSQRLERIKTEADRLINNRITSLNNLLQRVGNDSRLPNDEKASLKSSIQSTIDGLTALKTKIDADTVADTAKADTKTIITNYYIYRMFDPKTRLLLAVSNLQALSTKLAGTSASIQTLINTLKNEGKDTSVLQGLLDDINSKFLIITTTLTNDKTKLDALTTTSDFSSTITQVKQDLQTVKTDFQKIRNDISQMRTDFRGITKSIISTPAPTQ